MKWYRKFAFSVYWTNDRAVLIACKEVSHTHRELSIGIVQGKFLFYFFHNRETNRKGNRIKKVEHEKDYVERELLDESAKSPKVMRVLPCKPKKKNLLFLITSSFH